MRKPEETRFFVDIRYRYLGGSYNLKLIGPFASSKEAEEWGRKLTDSMKAQQRPTGQATLRLSPEGFDYYEHKYVPVIEGASFLVKPATKKLAKENKRRGVLPPSPETRAKILNNLTAVL